MMTRCVACALGGQDNPWVCRLCALVDHGVDYCGPNCKPLHEDCSSSTAPEVTATCARCGAESCLACRERMRASLQLQTCACPDCPLARMCSRCLREERSRGSIYAQQCSVCLTRRCNVCVDKPLPGEHEHCRMQMVHLCLNLERADPVAVER
jgi:hypothetical protein